MADPIVPGPRHRAWHSRSDGAPFSRAPVPWPCSPGQGTAGPRPCRPMLRRAACPSTMAPGSTTGPAGSIDRWRGLLGGGLLVALEGVELALQRFHPVLQLAHLAVEGGGLLGGLGRLACRLGGRVQRRPFAFLAGLEGAEHAGGT